MREETVVVRSMVASSLMRSTLLKGTILGGIGAFGLLLEGIFLPLHEMRTWGFPLFLLSLALIAAGLLPYRRLKRLEEKPYKLTIGLNIRSGGEIFHFDNDSAPDLQPAQPASKQAMCKPKLDADGWKDQDGGEVKMENFTASQYQLEYSTKAPLFSVPIDAIQEIRYFEKGNSYGICLFLKMPMTEKIMIHDIKFNLLKFRRDSVSKEGCDLFFPYFSRKSFTILRESTGL